MRGTPGVESAKVLPAVGDQDGLHSLSSFRASSFAPISCVRHAYGILLSSWREDFPQGVQDANACPMLSNPFLSIIGRLKLHQG